MSDFFAYFALSLFISVVLLDLSRAVFINFGLIRYKNLPELTLVTLSALLIWFMMGREGSIGESAWTIAGYISGAVVAYVMLNYEAQRRIVVQPKIPNKALLVGVAGWLRFLVVILIYISPLRAFGDAAAEVTEAEKANPALVDNPAWESALLFTWSITSLSVLALIFAGICLRSMHHKSSVNIAIIIIWIVGPLGSIMIQFAALSLFGANEASGASDVGALFGATLFAATWTAYLLLSKRVANTYGKAHAVPDPIAS